ncbi:MAG: hypothetical protein WCO83_02250 [Alphaproteobacteria bacterium]
MPSLLGIAPHGLLTVIFGAMAVALFAWADREVGGDNPNPKSTGYGRVALYAVLAGGVGFLTSTHGLLTLGAMALIWIAYRSLPWKVGGSMTPRTSGEKLATLARHSLPALGLVVLYFAAGASPFAPEVRPVALLPFIAFAAFATSLSIGFTKVADAAKFEHVVADANAKVEKTRGLAFGLAMLVAGILA